MNTCLLHKQMLVLLHVGPVVSPHDVTQLFKRQSSGRENYKLEQQTGLWGMARTLTLKESSCCNSDSQNEGQQTAVYLLAGGCLWQNEVN